MNEHTNTGHMPYSISSDHSLPYDIIRIKVSFKKSIFLVTKRKSQEAKRLPANKQHLRPVGNPWSGHSGIQSQPLLHLLCDLELSTEDLTVPFPL